MHLRKLLFVLTFLSSILSAQGPASAMDFDGVVNNGAIAPNKDILSLATDASNTIEFWFKPEADEAGFPLLNNGKYGVQFQGTTQQLRFYNYGNWINGGTTKTDWNLGQWYHLAWSNGKVYIDGVFDSNISGPRGRDGDHFLRIGCFGYTVGFNGEMDEVRFWSDARSCNEIVSYMNCELTGTEDGLIAYYNFNQGVVGADNSAITQLLDSGPNSYHLDLVDMSLTGSVENFIESGAVTLGTSCSGLIGPEIDIKQSTTNIADGGSYNFGSVEKCSTTDVVFTIENTGGAILNITTPLSITGADASLFSIQSQPSSSVSVSGNTTFTVRFSPTTSGSKTAFLAIINDDCDENPYNITLNGTIASSGGGSGVIVTGADEPGVDGTYLESGTWGIESYYTRSGGGTPYYIYFDDMWWSWVIGPTLGGDLFDDGLYESGILISNFWNPFYGSSFNVSTTSPPPPPEINLKQGMTDISDPGSYDFGGQAVGSNTDVVFTIENTGDENLTLTTPLTIGGADASEFSIQSQPTSPIVPCGTTTFTVRFSPTTSADKVATIDIANNDDDENPYNLTLISNNTDNSDGPNSYGNAGHTVDTDIHLGATVTVDDDDYGSGDASGDTDDGVVSFETWTNGTVIGPGYLPDGSTGSVTMDDDTYAVLVKATNNTGTAAQLVGWIDWNRNDVFDDPAERSVTVLDGVTGNVPDGSNNEDVVIYWDGQTKNGTASFARFRITTDASFKSPTSPSPTGNAGDGEVEDYRIGDGALPVELASFTVDKTLKGVICKWTTESEIENLGFFLERKTDGTDWKEIVSYKSDNTLLGQGTTSAPTDYEFLDKLVNPNTIYDYRLADVDYDGVITYHSVRTVTVDKVPLSSKVEKFTVLPAYPNPFNPSTTINYGLDIDSEVSILIYDITGKLINTLMSSEQKQGWHSVIWNGTSYNGEQVPAGIYLSKITSNNNTKTIKLMLLK